MNLRPPRPERGALPDCATLRLVARTYNYVPGGPQAHAADRRVTSAVTQQVTRWPRSRQRRSSRLAARRWRAAARLLAAGGLVAFPTETVYGLGADATNGQAVARLYDAKGRPAFNPLIAHVADAAAARRLARFEAAAERLAAAFWPGPLTLVLPKARGLSGRRACHRRPRHHRGARARPSGRARHSDRVRPAGGGAVRQPLRPRLADHRAARAGRSARAHRADRRRRTGADGAWNRPSSPASARRSCCGPARCPAPTIERRDPACRAVAGRRTGRQRGRGAARARTARLPLCAARAAAARCPRA